MPPQLRAATPKAIASARRIRENYFLTLSDTLEDFHLRRTRWFASLLAISLHIFVC
jgi:hypothetical protein